MERVLRVEMERRLAHSRHRTACEVHFLEEPKGRGEGCGWSWEQQKMRL